MKVGIISTAVPLVFGGGRFIVDWLEEKLAERGHQVEVVYVPTTDDPPNILPQMTAMRLMKLDDYFERVIAIRPPAHMIKHPHKVLWFIHHLRMFYDMWGTVYSPISVNAHGEAFRKAIFAADTAAMREAKHLFTNSKVVGDRIRRFNGLESEVLYPPVLRPEIFESGQYGEEIVCVCRVEHHKRQHLMVEAMALTKTNVRLRLCGTTMNPNYVEQLRNTVGSKGLSDRVTIEDKWITEEEKAARLKTALASAYMPFDEDSYGYPTIEAAHAERCTITVSDSGGVPEFVLHNQTGLVTDPTPEAVAQAMDHLYLHRDEAQRLGSAARQRVKALGIDWDTVIEKLLS